MGLSGILHISLSHLTPCPQSPQNEINNIFLLKKKQNTVCKKPSSDLPTFRKHHREKRIAELLLFYLFSLLNESTVLWEMSGTFFKNLTLF